MTRLTEEMVIARSKQSDLSAIKKLNCWGAELTDVSILIRMVNVEVLALSINKIRTLIDFQHCRRLKELYVRKNRLTDLSEVRHLRALPALRVLWLGENPCAEQPNYRLTVLRALPRLEKLDNINVESEEIEEAARKGNPIHSDGEEDSEPELDNYTNQYWSKNDDSTDRDDYRNGDQEQTTYTSRPSAVMRSPPATTNGGRSSQDYDNGPANHGHGRPSALPRSPPNGTTYIQTSPVRQRCYSPEPVEETRYEQPPQRSQYFERSASVGDDLSGPPLSRQNPNDDTITPHLAGETPHNGPVNDVTYRRSIQHSQSAHSIKESSPMNGDHGREGRYHPQHHSARHSVVSPHAECYYDRYASQNLEPQAPAPYNGGAPPREREREREAWERDSVTSTQIASNVMADHRGFTRRPMTRNSNLLSAVLCLVKELDYTSLEVAEMAVRCRMDELANRP